MKGIIKYLALFALLVGSAHIRAQSVALQDGQDYFQLSPFLELLEDPTGELTIREILDTSRSVSFQPLSNWGDDFFPQRIHWGKIEITNRLPDAQKSFGWVLHFSHVFTDIECYQLKDTGPIVSHKTGFFVPPADRSFAPILKANIINVLLEPHQKNTFYFKFKSERFSTVPEFDIQLEPTLFFFKELNRKKWNNALFMGFVLMMLIYNLFLFFIGKDAPYVYYSAYLLGMIFFSAYNAGDLANWLTPLFFSDHPQLIYFFKSTVYLVLFGYITFIRSFLDLKKLLPKWDTIFKVLTFWAIPFALLDYYLMINSNYSFDVSDKVTIGFSLIFVLLSFVFIVPLFKTKDKKGYFIIIGILLMGIGILFTIGARYNSVDFSGFYFKIGTILEIIVFSLGLAYRQREAEREKQIAGFELEKSKILQEQEHKESERLKELNEIKSRLYTNITHEFRTPLTVIMGMAENINGNEQARELICRNSENLLSLINQLLELSKAETGNLKLTLQNADIVNYLRYLTESFHSMAATKNIQLTFYAEEKELFMDFDESKIQHIIYNLLSNAIKYTPDNGKVIFHTRKEGGMLYLKVKDTGEGISSENQELVFDRFFQVDGSSTRKATGVGIGLALTKELVELMNGSISVTSQLKIGSEFVILLPITNNITNSAEPRSKIPQAKNTILENSVPALVPQDTNGSALPILLVIEDNPDVVTYIQSCLEGLYQIQIATNGQIGIDKATEIIPDIIICDLMMPKKDGFEVCKTLKSDQRTSHIPIILLTAKATQEDKVAGLQTGADAYMMKPFHKKELLVRLEKLVEIRKQLHAKYNPKVLAPTKKIKPPSTTLDDDFLQKIIVVIEEKLGDQNLAIADLCKAAHLSHTQVYRKIKALTGNSPSIFIRTYRLQKAMELIQNTKEPISDIAYRVGFNDPNYFSRSFSEYFGKTPRSIRK